MLRRQIAQTRQRRRRACRRPRWRRSTSYQNEQRTIEYVALGPAQAGDIPEPTPEAARQIFRGAQGRCSARRNTARSRCCSLTPADLAKPDAGLRRRRQEPITTSTRRSYGTPEKRELQQIVFPNAEEAAAARDKHRQGRDASTTSPTSAAEGQRHRPRHGRQRPASSIRPSPTPPSRSRQARSARRSRAASAPCSCTVGKIEPGSRRPSTRSRRRSSTRSPSSARARPRSATCATRSRTSAPAARRWPRPRKKLGLTARTIEAVDRSGRGPDGKPVAGLPKAPDVVAAAFATDVGVDNEPLQLPNGGYSGSTSTGITPSRDRTLDEVKDQVEARWRDDEIAKRLKAKADRDARQAQGRHARSTQVATEAGAQGRNGDRSASAASRAASCRPSVVEAVFQHAEGRAGQRRRRQADRAVRVSRHRRSTMPHARSDSPSAKQRSTTRCRAPTPTT